MSESSDAINSLAGEMRAGFASTGQRISTLENELHRHQDEDRADMSAMRVDIREVQTSQERFMGRIEGSLGMLKWLLGIPAVVAAAGTIVSLVHRW